MGEITTLFWDVGGVLLTNGWDRSQRQRAVERFGLEEEEFEARHEKLVEPLEAGQINLGAYLEQTVFYKLRPFSKEEFRRFLFAQSDARPESLAVVEEMARTRRYLMATINNEALEVNVYRIRQFGLRQYFSAFFSSCFLGVRKPSGAIYQRALGITQRDPNECVMIDDREENLEAPARMGMRVVRFESAAQLRDALARWGVEGEAAA